MKNEDTNENQEGANDHRRFPVEIDDDKFELTQAKVSGAELMKLVKRAPCRYALVQVIIHADDQFIDPAEIVDLSAVGKEKFVTVQKDDVTIYVNGNPYPARRGTHTVAQILALVGQAPDAYDLLEERNGPPIPVPAGLPVEIEGCEIFHIQVRSGGSS